MSAVLDGEASTDETADVLADPVLSRRLAEFELVRSVHLSLDDDLSLQDTPGRTSEGDGSTSDPDSRRDQRVALALTTLDDTDTDDLVQDTTTVVAMDDRLRSRRRLEWVAAAAATLLIVTFGAVIVRTGDQGEADSIASSNTSAVTEDAGRGAGAADDGSMASTTIPDMAAAEASPSMSVDASPDPESAAPTDDTAGSLPPADKTVDSEVELGNFTDMSSLRRAAIDATRGLTHFVDPPSCATNLIGTSPVLSASARLGGAAVVVLVRPTSSGIDPSTPEVTVLDPTTCRAVG